MGFIEDLLKHKYGEDALAQSHEAPEFLNIDGDKSMYIFSGEKELFCYNNPIAGVQMVDMNIDNIDRTSICELSVPDWLLWDYLMDKNTHKIPTNIIIRSANYIMFDNPEEGYILVYQDDEALSFVGWKYEHEVYSNYIQIVESNNALLKHIESRMSNVFYSNVTLERIRQQDIKNTALLEKAIPYGRECIRARQMIINDYRSIDFGLKPECTLTSTASLEHEGCEVIVDGTKDMVNHPPHYTSHPSGIECIEVTRHYDFCIGNAIKYLWRCGLKTELGMTDKEKEIEDLKKAVWYINDKIKTLEGNPKSES